MTSFNAVTVDGDTSTNDTLIVAATGKADHPELAAGDAAAAAFGRGLSSSWHRSQNRLSGTGKAQEN